MAAGTWTIYDTFKEYAMDGTVDLDTTNFRMTLHTSAYTPATTHSVIGSVGSEVTSAAKYSSSGQALAAVTWATGDSASEMRFDATANVWSASGATIANVRYAVIWASGASAGLRKLVAYAALSTAQFSISDGDTLTVTPSANGIFELN